MTIRSEEPAPYGPPAGILAVINGFRDRGLATPFTPDVLIRAGISDSLVPRVLKSLEGLDLIDTDGRPTPAMEGLRRAPTDEFKARLADVVRAAYAEVFQFTDPATDDLTRVSDAFRSYKPEGQRARMVTLFMGLCEAAAIVPEGTTNKKQAAPSGRTRERASSITPKTGSKKSGNYRGPSVGPKAPVHNDSESAIAPALLGLLASVPSEGASWTKEQRDKFMTAFGHVLDFTVPIGSPKQAADDDDDE